MRLENLKSKTDTLIAKKNSYMLISIGLLLVVVIQAAAILFKNNETIVIEKAPEICEGFWLSRTAVSPEYIRQMSGYYSYLALHRTTSNVKQQNDILLKHVDSSYYGEFKSLLAEQIEKTKASHISSSFDIEDIKVDAKELIAIVSGQLTISLGKEILPPKRVSYEFKYKYKNGRLLISTFKEVKNNA